MCGPRGEVIHVGLEIFGDAGLIGGRDVGTGVAEGQRAYMAASCAWRMVSKLNVNPFQAVNSPLVEPVSMRRPSGVHCERH